MESLEKGLRTFGTPTRSFVAPSFEKLSSLEINEKLAEGKKLYDAMFKLDDLIELHQRHSLDIEQKKFHLQEITMTMESGTWQQKDEIDNEISKLESENRNVLREIVEIQEHIERMFDEIEKDEDPTIKRLVQKRRDVQTRLDSHKCVALGTVKNICLELDKVLREVTLHILMKHTEFYWQNRSLAAFRASEDFPYPGRFQAHPAYLDVKAVAEWSQKFAIISTINETEAVERIIAANNLSIMFVKYPERKIVYRPDSAAEARAAVDLLETNGNKSNNPEVVYAYYLRLGKLLDQPIEVRRKYALEKAKEKNPEFIPQSEN